jgi:hypothetical protein
MMARNMTDGGAGRAESVGAGAEDKPCTKCRALFPVNKLLLTGDGYLCQACELEPIGDVEAYEGKLHRKTASGALALALLSIVLVWMFRWGLLFTAPMAFKLALNAFHKGRERGDAVAPGVAVLALVLTAASLVLAVGTCMAAVVR